LLQTIVEERMRGRVMSFYAMAFMGTAPFGSLLAGALAARIGAPATIGVGGAVCLVAAVWFSLKLPALRERVRPIYERLGIIPEVAEGMREGATRMGPSED
jgi:MFS family permease